MLLFLRPPGILGAAKPQKNQKVKELADGKEMYTPED